MQENKTVDPLTITIAFQALLKHRQVTYLLVDRQNHPIHIYDDGLGLLKSQTHGNNISLNNDVCKLLPAELQGVIDNVLKQAQQVGKAQRNGYQVTLHGDTSFTIAITANLHVANDANEFLTLLIEHDGHGKGQTVSKSIDHYTTELIEVNERLRAKVLEQQKTEQELAYKAQALAQSNANLEEFAYVVSHDLQEPLRAITAFSQLLEQRYGQKLGDSAKGYITHIVDGGTRMKAMIDGILELSRINTQKRLTHSPTNLEQALETALENLEFIRTETQATVTNETLPTIDIDQNHAVQLLQNLIGNAIKFRGPESPKIHISATQQHHHWLFSVQDNGIGIPQSQQKRIFKLFQRLHNQQEYQGYGIGLAICKKIVEHYQGNIWLKSTPGEGTTFYFTLTTDIDYNEA